MRIDRARLLRAKRAVGAAYVAEHADPRTLDLIVSLELENADLRAEIEARQRPRIVTERRVMLGRAITAAFAVLLLVYNLYRLLSR